MTLARIIAVIVTLLVVAAAYLAWTRITADPAVATEAVRQEKVERILAAVGRIKPKESVTVLSRVAGQIATMPVDGVSTATKPVGKHAMSFSEGSKALPKLAPGSYKLVIEAAREVGGRELVSVPFEWPPKQATSLTATGKEELGAISLTLKP